jgi:hypothetical protein
VGDGRVEESVAVVPKYFCKFSKDLPAIFFEILFSNLLTRHQPAGEAIDGFLPVYLCYLDSAAFMAALLSEIGRQILSDCILKISHAILYM